MLFTLSSIQQGLLHIQCKWQYSKRKPCTEWALTNKEKCFFFPVYSLIDTDFKITVPQERNSTQITSTVESKLFMHNWNHWPNAMDSTAVQCGCKLIINNSNNSLPVWLLQTVCTCMHSVFTTEILRKSDVSGWCHFEMGKFLSE